MVAALIAVPPARLAWHVQPALGEVLGLSAIAAFLNRCLAPPSGTTLAQLFGPHLGHRLDFLRPQFGQTLRCQFGR